MSKVFFFFSFLFRPKETQQETISFSHLFFPFFLNKKPSQLRPLPPLARGRPHRLPGPPPRLPNAPDRPDQPHRGASRAAPHRAELHSLRPGARRVCRRRRPGRRRQRRAQALPARDLARVPVEADEEAPRGLRQQQGVLLGVGPGRADGRRPAHHRGRREVLRVRVRALLVHF